MRIPLSLRTLNNNNNHHYNKSTLFRLGGVAPLLGLKLNDILLIVLKLCRPRRGDFS